MAIVKTVCGDCGAVVSRGDVFCSRCGAKVDWGYVVEVPGIVTAKSVSCAVCGHANQSGGAFCESCGSRLQEEKVPVRVPEKESRPKKNPPPPKVKSAKRKAETWQWGAGALLLGVVAIFVYTEMNRIPAPSRFQPAENLPVQSTGMIEEVERLQKIVDANPKDAATSIRLANALHDLSMNDRRFVLRAIGAYQKYLGLNPDDPDARVDLGIMFFELARVDSVNAGVHMGEAIREMEAVTRSHPKHQPAAFNLGIVNLNAGNSNEAQEWFRKTVEINPSSDLGSRAKKLLEQHGASPAPQ